MINLNFKLKLFRQCYLLKGFAQVVRASYSNCQWAFDANIRVKPNWQNQIGIGLQWTSKLLHFSNGKYQSAHGDKIIIFPRQFSGNLWFSSLNGTEENCFNFFSLDVINTIEAKFLIKISPYVSRNLRVICSGICVIAPAKKLPSVIPHSLLPEYLFLFRNVITTCIISVRISFIFKPGQ